VVGGDRNCRELADRSTAFGEAMAAEQARRAAWREVADR